MNCLKKSSAALTFAASFVTALCLTGGNVQAQSTAAIALVYISSSPSSNNYQINAYSAAPDGKLTAVPGSPFVEDGVYMAVTQKWLFSTDTINIYSFSIASNGALNQVSSINAQQYNGYNDGGPVNLFLDHTGATLYDEDIYGNNGANNTYQFFDVNRSTGALAYLGATTSASPEFNRLHFIGNNLFAYGSSCYHGFQDIYGFGRSSDGTLTDLNLNPPIPAMQGGAYCPYLAAAGTTNHVAISLTPTNDLSIMGPTQLAIYTADGSGNLTTTSTDANMPQVAVGGIIDMSMAPSGKLLAVAGAAGLQVFHVDGANPITRYTGLLTQNEVDQVFWDNDNHLYAISQSAGKLYVFTLTPRSFGQASGSPYAITSPQNVTVLSKTHECRSERRPCTNR